MECLDMKCFEIVPTGSHRKTKFKVGGKRATRLNARVAYAGETAYLIGFLLLNKDTDKFFLLVPCPTGDVSLPIWSRGDKEQMETCIILPVV
jgi:hypothetical protein